MGKLRLFLALLCPLAFSADYYPPSDAQGGWRTGPAGMDVRRLDDAFRYAQQTNAHGGLVVVRHGYLVYEKYFGRAHREALPDMASIGKAYTSIAVGIMLDEKRAQIPEGLETKVFDGKFLPNTDPAKSGIKLGHLLSMSSGMRPEGANPGLVNGKVVRLDAPPRAMDPMRIDENALEAPLWTTPGGGYAYSSQSTHLASLVLRRLTGMELQQYIDAKLAKPMGWGQWGYALHRSGFTLPHTPGGGSIAVRATDVVRFAYLLLHNGRWGSQQLVPAAYVAMCAKPSPYNPHSPFGLQLESNSDGHVIGAPRDAYFKSGAGGSAIYIVPSLDLVAYKVAGSNAQFEPSLTGIAASYTVDHSRDDWKPGPHTQFHDGPIGGDDGVRRLLEMVVAAVVK